MPAARHTSSILMATVDCWRSVSPVVGFCWCPVMPVMALSSTSTVEMPLL